MGYKVEQIEQLKKVLAALPKLRTSAARIKTIDALRLMKNDIDNLQRKGYGLDAIAAILGQHGLPMSGKTLRIYLSKIRLDPSHEPDNKPLPDAPSAPHHKAADVPPAQPLSRPLMSGHASNAASSLGTRGDGGFALHPDTEDL